LHEHHEVDDSLREKLKCLIFIPTESLFNGRYYRSYSGRAFGRFDVHPDGDRFLMLQYAAESEIENQVHEIQMVINWQQDIINQ